MRIEIAERLKPFSHQPGIAFVLPGTCLRFTIWPVRIAVDDLSAHVAKRVADFSLEIQGPLKDFTVVQDLEKGILRVWGHSPMGYLEYHILASQEGCALTLEKAPNRVLNINNAFLETGKTLQISVKSNTISFPSSIERLSLGSHKKQDWIGIQTRFDLMEVLPLWFRLGQLVPKTTSSKDGTAALLDVIDHAIRDRDILAISDAFRNLLLAGFDQGLSPRLVDSDHQGFVLPEVDKHSSPLVLLTEGAKLIRSLFIQQHDNEISILPAVPPEFHCGRMCGIECADIGQLDLEWSKKIIRRMTFKPQKASEIKFIFQKEVKRFRLRAGNERHGKIVMQGTKIAVEPNKVFYFDRFEK